MASVQPRSEEKTDTKIQAGRLQTLNSLENQVDLDPLNETTDDPLPAQLTQHEVVEELERLDSIGEKITIFSCKNGKLFFININGEVSSTLESNNVTIFKVKGHLGESIFLRVGTWVYPLFSELSPCFRSEQDIFIFPDIYSEHEGTTVGLTLPEDESEALHLVLSELLGITNDKRTRRNVLSTDSSRGVDTTSSYLARNIVRCAEHIAGYLDSAGTQYANQVKRNPVTEINPNWVKTAAVANMVSGKASNILGGVNNQLGKAVSALGNYISPYISHEVNRVVPQKVVKLTVNSLRGIGEIYNGLEESAAILGRSVSNNTVKIVNEKYGTTAGHLTSDVISTIGNIYTARRNITLLKPKSLVKATLRSAGNAMIEDRRNLMTEQSGRVEINPGSSLSF